MSDAQEIAAAIRQEQERADRAPGRTRATKALNEWMRSEAQESKVEITVHGAEPMPDRNRQMGDFLRARRGKRMTNRTRGNEAA